MSKGSKRRPCDESKVRNNWDRINWSKKKHEPHPIITTLMEALGYDPDKIKIIRREACESGERSCDCELDMEGDSASV